MKTNHFFAAVAALFVAVVISSCNSKKFEISGTITEATDSILYLENISLDGPQVVDSVKLSAAGDFRFSEKATDAPEFYRLRIHGNIVNVSIDSTETVSVKASYPTMAYKYEIEGSENCSKIKELTLLQQALQREVNAIIKDPQLGMTAVGDSIDQIVVRYKENVKRNYIFKAPNQAYAYFALFQTIVVGYNQVLIFNPRVSEEDVRVFGAVATSWDTFYPGAVRGENLHNIAIEQMKNARIVQSQQAKVQQALEADKVDTSGRLDIALHSNNGSIARLSDLKGKVVLLDFTLYSADYARERIILLRELYSKYHDQGFDIYQVSFDPEEHFWKTQTQALPWTTVYEPAGMDSPLITTFNLQGFPTFFLLDRDNLIQHRDSQIPDIDAAIRALL